jgi:hypothetical protein
MSRWDMVFERLKYAVSPEPCCAAGNNCREREARRLRRRFH